MKAITHELQIYKLVRDEYINGHKVYKDYKGLDYIVVKSDIIHAFIILFDYDNDLLKRQLIQEYVNKVDYLYVFFKNPEDLKKINLQNYKKGNINLLNFDNLILKKQQKNESIEFEENWLNEVLRADKLQQKQQNMLFQNQIETFPKELQNTIKFIADIEKIYKPKIQK